MVMLIIIILAMIIIIRAIPPFLVMGLYSDARYILSPLHNLFPILKQSNGHNDQHDPTSTIFLLLRKNYSPSNSSGDKARPPCMCSFSFYQNLFVEFCAVFQSRKLFVSDVSWLLLTHILCNFLCIVVFIVHIFAFLCILFILVTLQILCFILHILCLICNFVQPCVWTSSQMAVDTVYSPRQRSQFFFGTVAA